jgi:hypothetical protein
MYRDKGSSWYTIATSPRPLGAVAVLLRGICILDQSNRFIIQSHRPDPSQHSTPALELLALLLAFCLVRFSHLRTRSSSILLLFWPCYTIALSIWTRSYAQTFPVAPLAPLKWADLFWGCFPLECISPDDTQIQTPETRRLPPTYPAYGHLHG